MSLLPRIQELWRDRAALAARAVSAALAAAVRVKNSRLVRATIDTAVRIRNSRLGRATVALAVRLKNSRAGRAVGAALLRLKRRVIVHLDGSLTNHERRLLDELRGGRQPACLLRTRTRVDVGEWVNEWWGGGRLWLAVLGTEVTLFAYGRRPHVERIPIAGLGASQYNAVTGELLLAKAAGETLHKLRLPQLQGWQVLGLMVGSPEAGRKIA